MSDTVHQFAPTYQEACCTARRGAPRKICMKTHVMMGQEMRDARKWSGGGGSEAPRAARAAAARAERLGGGHAGERGV